MKNHQRTTPRKNHPGTTPGSSSHSKPHQKGGGIQSTLDSLLTTDETFYWAESKYLARRAAAMGVPRSDVPDVVAEVWMEAVKHRHEFVGVDAVRRLHGWMMQVVHSKAVDALRRREQHRYEALDTGKEEPFDAAEAKRAETAERNEWLDVLLAKVWAGNEVGLRWLWAHACEACSLQQLARQSGVKRSAVESRIRRLRIKLRDLAE